MRECSAALERLNLTADSSGRNAAGIGDYPMRENAMDRLHPGPRWVAALSASTTLLLGACSSGSAPAQPPSPFTYPSSSPPSQPASPSVATTEQQAITAYLGMWNDMAVAGETSNWQDPRLSRNATGTALTNITRGLYANQSNGLVSKGRPKSSPRVLSTETGKIVIEDCGDSSTWLLYRADTGALADEEPGGRRHINAVVERQSDGVWRVTDFGIHELGSC
ncbi:hypothetical protein [Amycolatopsis magusensis]|uniref:Lipoprotein n=1 Tax=Amycolatopsis magusensis TaxID=882444 RepID=A0ABS4PWB5_9PSEU|nr:hypothetical protein [Amycolatopsis magusensis]MBP2182876.1 hypothetical protein [Amycolatopsis magusensis]